MAIVIYDGAIVRRFETLDEAIDGIRIWHQADRFPPSVQHAYSVAVTAIPAPDSLSRLRSYVERLSSLAARLTVDDCGAGLVVDVAAI